VRLKTERLLLRPFERRDHAAYAAINADPETMRYFEAPFSRAESDASIQRSHEGLAKKGFHFLAAELKSTGELAGVIGIGRFDEITREAIPGHPEVEIGWRLAPHLWGQGLAPEGALACIDHAWQVLHLPELVAITTEHNAPSRRVMDKIGMHYVPTADFDHPRVPPGSPVRRHVVYRIVNPAAPA
jgi:RimJ/RimL family protein N-acetyltransferase